VASGVGKAVSEVRQFFFTRASIQGLVMACQRFVAETKSLPIVMIISPGEIADIVSIVHRYFRILFTFMKIKIKIPGYEKVLIFIDFTLICVNNNVMHYVIKKAY
jgi:hypothetical protein